MKKDRAEYMSDRQQEKMKGIPRSHANCKSRTGVMRPGKTAKDRARS